MRSVCHCITLRRASRRMTALYDEMLAPAGVNLAQYSLMRNIATRGPVSLTELAARVELDRSTVGRNVKVLEKMGLVAAAPGADQREQALSLTERGASTLKQATPLWQAAQDRVEALLGPDGTERLEALLQAL
jgi:DNA-binding MarR family transcriptional regulator